MVGFAEDGTEEGHHLSEEGGRKRLYGGDVWEVFVDVSNESDVSFFEEGEVLFLVPCGVFLHGEMGAVVLLGLFEVVPVFEMKPVVLVICKQFD